jgi:hypothetical protein
MRSAVGLVVALLVTCLSQSCPAQGLPGSAPGLLPPGALASSQVRTGTVLAIDSVSMNLVSTERNGTATYWMTRATRFRSGARAATFFDLQTGQRVRVAFHRTGGQDVADLVVF